MQNLVGAGSCREGGVRFLADGGVPGGRGGSGRAVRVGPVRCPMPAAILPVRRHGEPLPYLRDAHPAGERKRSGGRGARLMLAWVGSEERSVTVWFDFSLGCW